MGEEQARKKLNCWEFKKCGRQPGGYKEKDLGICPASTEKALDGIHGGRNAGRACWVVAGTRCRGSIQGTYALKIKDCIECDFYKYVRKGEYPDFHLITELLSLVEVQ